MLYATRRVFLILALVASCVFATQRPLTDESDIRRLVSQFEIAWNSHDMTILGQILSNDVDFVNVAGLHWKGRAEVVGEHAARHKVRFKDSVWTTEKVEIQFIRPDIALVHVDWSTSGDLDFELKPWGHARGYFFGS